jgi:hypothetical protein
MLHCRTCKGKSPYFSWENGKINMVSCKVVPPGDSVQLVNITLISLWFMVLITIVFMGFINQLITGGHIVGFWAMELVNTSCIVAMDYFIGIV